MTIPHEDSSNQLQIRCPSCGQRFKVEPELKGRTVECGSCEHRFRVDDEVIFRVKKFYPGEQNRPDLTRYQRVPLAAPAPQNLRTVFYGSKPDPAVIEPASPQRILAGAAAVAGMALMAALLMLGAKSGGMLDGVIQSKRLVMAGFAVLLGTVLLVYANPRARLKALAVSLLMGAGVMTVPFFFKEGSVPLTTDPSAVEADAAADEVPDDKPPVDSREEELQALSEKIGLAPLRREQQRLLDKGVEKKAMGLWMRGLRESNRFLIRDYLMREAETDTLPHFFPRGRGDFLLVVSGVDLSLEEMAVLISKLGSVERIHKELDVIEVRVDNSIFLSAPLEKLTDSEDPEFYDLNRKELDSIDLDRVRKAVKRLAEVEPKVYRNDISRRLVELLQLGDADFQADVCQALVVWAEDLPAVGKVVAPRVLELSENSAAVPREMIALLVKARNTDVIPVLGGLWFRDPTKWESLYAELGPAIEPDLIARYPDTAGSLRHSATRLLAKVGGEASLPLLDEAMPTADSELKILIERARKDIQERK